MTFLNILDDYVKSLDALIETEQKKLICIQKNDILGVEAIMKEEQALSLKLRGIDIKREEYQKNNNLLNLTFSEIIEQSDNNDELKAYYNNMKQKVSDLNQTMDSSKKLIEVHLHNIDETLKGLNVKVKDSYDSEGKIKQSAFSTGRGRRV